MRNQIYRKRAMRHICRVIQVSIICFIALFAIFFVQVEAKASTRSAYQTYANKHFSAKKYPYLKCILYDINKDGTQEMIVRYESGVRNAYQVYTYKKGKVKKLHTGEFLEQELSTMSREKRI